MHLTLFASSDAAGFLPQWTDESVAVIFGSAVLDLTRHPPAATATLRVRAIFGSVRVIVPSGCRLSVSGLGLFGSRRVNAQPGDGPGLHLRAVAVFGSIEVIESPADAAPLPAASEEIFLPETGISGAVACSRSA